MKPIRVVIVDDEPPAREKLRGLLAREADFQIVGEAENGDDAVRLCLAEKPDLLFVDIQMPPADGFSVVKAVREVYAVNAVFITAHAQHAVDAFVINAVDYLLKPFSRERLAMALDRVRSQAIERASSAAVGTTDLPDKFFIKAGSRYLIVKITDIVWIESAANYVVLHTPNGNHVLRRTLSSLSAELEAWRFFRINRSMIINLENVREVQLVANNDYIVHLTDGARLPLTRGLRELQRNMEMSR